MRSILFLVFTFSLDYFGRFSSVMLVSTKVTLVSTKVIEATESWLCFFEVADL